MNSIFQRPWFSFVIAFLANMQGWASYFFERPTGMNAGTTLFGGFIFVSVICAVSVLLNSILLNWSLSAWRMKNGEVPSRSYWRGKLGGLRLLLVVFLVILNVLLSILMIQAGWRIGSGFNVMATTIGASGIAIIVVCVVGVSVGWGIWVVRKLKASPP